MTTAQATGDIKMYQILISIVTILNLPLSYLILKMGAAPVSVFVISFCTSFICIFVRLFCIKRLICSFPILKYVKNVLGNIFVVSFVSAIIPLFLYIFLPNIFWTNMLICGISLISTFLSIFFFGLTLDERVKIKSVLLNKIRIRV